MAKKKFKDGLESLFDQVHEESFSPKSPLLFETGQQQEAPQKKAKPSSGKHFSDDLDLFFQESLKESMEQELKAPSPALKAARGNRSARPKDGLDALIRRTVESTEIELHYDESRKRVVLTFDKDKLSKLKQIAKLEKTMLKEMIARVVADYIREYEQKKGYLG